MNIAFVPIDNRPVCYTLPYRISKIDSSVNLFMPDRALLGSLTKPSNTEGILRWLEALKDIDAIIISLDTIAYGGLITSRRCDDSLDSIKIKLDRLKKFIQNKKVYAFSSIMRISNNNINQEEKPYWSEYGKKIFEYSYNFHKNNKTETDIPKPILDDYLQTRKRNFEVNKIYLNWQNEGLFEKLIFSKDDCAQYGLNVLEAKQLSNLGGFVKTGADEIPLTLLARAVNDYRKKKIKIAPIFIEPEYKNLISNYEDISVEASTISQIELANCTVTTVEDADILLYVNNFIANQGEIVMKLDTKPYSKKWIKPHKPYIIADVRFTNGSDNSFINEIFKTQIDNNFLGYAGWNTSANTLGSLICAASMSFNKKNNDEFKKLQAVRLLDDWAYQANVRQMLEKPDKNLCAQLMKPYEKKVWQFLDTEYNTKYSFTWDRLFEVEIELN